MRHNLLGVPIDAVTLDEAVRTVKNWVENRKPNYVVTPNIEMIMLAQKDSEFTRVLSEAGLAIPDSARLGWGIKMQQLSFVGQLLNWPFFLLPTLMADNTLPITTGTDLMEKLIILSSEKGFRIGLLGGQKNVAIKLADRLVAQHPNLKIEFIQENLTVDQSGNHQFFNMQNLIGFQQNDAISDAREADFYDNLNSRKLDILFVAFGHIKQEKWINKNLPKTNVSVMLGIGGAFDYLSGEISRAPQWLRQLGFEWLYRVLLQPWRIFRFGNLVKFVILIIFKKPQKV
jgi:N-acetylglucosaminyldiphosphoundecaprenol N-acetyl-beta-D-mannosaminyltransferase